MLPRWRRNSPCRQGLPFSENKIFGVHLPIKIEGGIFDSCTVFIVSCLRRTFLSEITFRIFLSHLSFAARQRPSLPERARQAQLGTYVCLGWQRLRYIHSLILSGWAALYLS